MKARTCVCGTSFRVYPPRTGQRYCSLACSDAARIVSTKRYRASEKGRTRHKATQTDPTLTCAACGRTFYAKAREIRLRRRRFCSLACSGKANLIDLTGQRFGQVVVLEHVGRSRWAVRCDCGKTWVTWSDHLRRGNVISCGHALSMDEICYRTRHARIARTRGAAATHLCVDCGQQAHNWSLREGVPAEFLRADAGGRSGGVSWSIRDEDYEPRCIPCHRWLDHSGTKHWSASR